MVIDSSAIIAILFGEPEADNFARLIDLDKTRFISTVTYLESSIVAELSKASVGIRELDLLIYKNNIDVIPFDALQMDLARNAYMKYGKGRHPAHLNLGDCASYALSKSTGEPLLFKGDDFKMTDVEKML